MTTPVGPPNYRALYRCQVGREVTRGVNAAKTNRWYGLIDLQRRHTLAESEEYSGSFFSDIVPARGPAIVDGTYTQVLSYEDAHLFLYAIQGGVTGVSDGNPTPGFLYTFRHAATRDNLATFSVESGDPVMVFESEGVLFPEFTIAADIDDTMGNWRFSARAIAQTRELKAPLADQVATGGTTTTFVRTAWGQTSGALVGRWVHFKTGTAANIGLWREVTANDATSITFAALPAAVAANDTIDVYAGFVSGIADRARELIAAPGTRLWIDPHGGTLGATQITGRFISFSLTSQLNTGYKRFMENVNRLSNLVDRGRIRVAGQLRLEFDRRAEWDRYTAFVATLIRIRQEGSIIDAGASSRRSIQLDLYEAVFEDPVIDTRGNNHTVTVPFRAYMDETGQGVPMQLAIRNRQTTLLA